MLDCIALTHTHEAAHELSITPGRRNHHSEKDSCDSSSLPVTLSAYCPERTWAHTRHGKPMHIFISAGEPSGDLHGSNLIRALLEQQTQVRLSGFGGERILRRAC